jgi:nitrogen-specific signal transduction histidine kinase/CheY-like chemotaxis protein
MQAQQALEIAQQESQRASEAKSAFMANMSHELRTPMTAVLGFADMLGEELSDPSHIGKVETIKRNGEYLLALLNDILDLSKIEAGQLKIERHTLNVKNLIEEVHTLMDIRAVEEGIPLYVDWNPAIPLEITADETRVRQVLVNLISNALKFTDHGEVRIGVDVNQQEGQPILEISVTDTGIGIYQQQLSELFKPFSQTGFSQRRRFGGTGLGLSISKRLAEGMGGAISVESEPGVGSRFTLSLPLSAKQLEKQYSSPALALAPTSSPVVAQEALPTIESRILLADDRRDIWRIGKYFLEKAGATVTVVEDGLQAVEETERAARDGRPFDLIIMDMQMPVMTGPEAVAELRQAGFDRPIIALTADVMDGEREACIAMGCNDYFPKPINGSGLVKLVAMHLGAR